MKTFLILGLIVVAMATVGCSHEPTLAEEISQSLDNQTSARVPRPDTVVQNPLEEMSAPAVVPAAPVKKVVKRAAKKTRSSKLLAKGKKKSKKRKNLR